MTTHRHRLLLGSILPLLSAFSVPARAEVVISIGNLSLAPGGTGYVDVTIASDNGTDLVDTFGAEFAITTGGSTRLEFVHPPTDPQLADSNYIFCGDSAGALAPPVGIVNPPYDTYIGGDGTLSGLGVTVPLPNPPLDKLLVSLEVTAPNGGSSPVAGDTFTVSLVEGSASTFFLDPAFGNIPFHSTSGTVTVVPEPGTFCLLLSAMAVFGWVSCKRLCRKHGPGTINLLRGGSASRGA